MTLEDDSLASLRSRFEQSETPCVDTTKRLFQTFFWVWARRSLAARYAVYALPFVFKVRN